MEKIKVNKAAAGSSEEEVKVNVHEDMNSTTENSADSVSDNESGNMADKNGAVLDNGENFCCENTLEEEIQRLKAENIRQRTEFETAIKELKINNAAEERLRNEGAKNPKLLLKLIDNSKIDFGEDGGLIGIDEQIDSLKRCEGYLFDNGKTVSMGCFRPEEAGDFLDAAKGGLSDMTYSQMIRVLGE